MMDGVSEAAVRTRYLTLLEAAAYLNVTERFMRRVVSERKVRFYKLGKFLRFDSADLDALATEHGVAVDDGLADQVWLSARRLS
jgi:excisionase family DNA binding protein